MREKFRLTKLEKSWVLYDVGNSAFTLLVSTLLPIYFNALATSAGVDENLYLSYWGYAGSIATILVAIIGPICGTLSDRKGYKKPLFLLCVGLGVLGCAALGLAKGWLLFLAIFILGKVGFNGSLVFYDSMLPEITTQDRIDNVSTQGYAWGYIGSVIPFVLCLVLVLAGGVAANSRIRGDFERLTAEAGIELYLPPLKLCGDNGAMIGAQAYYEFLAGVTAGQELNAYATLPIE